MKREDELIRKARETPLDHPAFSASKEFFDSLQLKHPAWPGLIYFATQVRLIQADPGMPVDTRARLIDVSAQTIQTLIRALFPESEYRQRMKELIEDTHKLTDLGFTAVDQLEAEGAQKH